MISPNSLLNHSSDSWWGRESERTNLGASMLHVCVCVKGEWNHWGLEPGRMGCLKSLLLDFVIVYLRLFCMREDAWTVPMNLYKLEVSICKCKLGKLEYLWNFLEINLYIINVCFTCFFINMYICNIYDMYFLIH